MYEHIINYACYITVSLFSLPFFCFCLVSIHFFLLFKIHRSSCNPYPPLPAFASAIHVLCALFHGFTSFGSPQYGPIYAYICRRFKRTLLNPLHVYELNKIKPFEEFNSFFFATPQCVKFSKKRLPLHLNYYMRKCHYHLFAVFRLLYAR